MKTITKEIKLFNYGELSQDAKKYALEKYISKNEYNLLPYDIKEELKNYIDDNKSIIYYYEKGLRVYYSLSYCQGDGVMFEGVFNYEVKHEQDIYNVYIKVKHSGRYYHENSKNIEVIEIIKNNKDLLSPPGDDTYQIIENIAISEFNDWYIKTCKQLKDYGYVNMACEDSEEYFISLCNDNEYMFTEDGTLYNDKI